MLGRLSHAHGLSQLQEDFRFRISGMGLTFTALVGAALGVLSLQFGRLLG